MIYDVFWKMAGASGGWNFVPEIAADTHDAAQAVILKTCVPAEYEDMSIAVRSYSQGESQLKTWELESMWVAQG